MSAALGISWIIDEDGDFHYDDGSYTNAESTQAQSTGSQQHYDPGRSQRYSQENVQIGSFEDFVTEEMYVHPNFFEDPNIDPTLQIQTSAFEDGNVEDDSDAEDSSIDYLPYETSSSDSSRGDWAQPIYFQDSATSRNGGHRSSDPVFSPQRFSELLRELQDDDVVSDDSEDEDECSQGYGHQFQRQQYRPGLGERRVEGGYEVNHLTETLRSTFEGIEEWMQQQCARRHQQSLQNQGS